MENQDSDRVRVNDLVRSNATAHVESLRSAMVALEDTLTATGVSASIVDAKLDAIEDALHYMRNTVRYACFTETAIRVGPFFPRCSHCGQKGSILGYYDGDSICGDCYKNRAQRTACYEECE